MSEPTSNDMADALRRAQNIAAGRADLTHHRGTGVGPRSRAVRLSGGFLRDLMGVANEIADGLRQDYDGVGVASGGADVLVWYGYPLTDTGKLEHAAYVDGMFDPDVDEV